MAKPRTVGELRRSGYEVLTVKEEMRKNLMRRLREEGDLLELYRYALAPEWVVFWT